MRNAGAVAGPLLKIQKSGDPAKKVDLLILGDGYTARERAKFERDARRLTATLFATSPFKERQRDINVWGLSPAAAQSGISRPSQGIYRRSPIGATYDAFGSERYVLTFDNKAFRDVAAYAPYEVVEILTNSATYGGGGIYNLYSTVAADSVWSSVRLRPRVRASHRGTRRRVLHVGRRVSAGGRSRRAVGAERDGVARSGELKWKDLVTPGVPHPDAVAERGVRALHERDPAAAPRDSRREAARGGDGRAVSDEEKRDTTLLNEGPHAGKVGAFEGAKYEARGITGRRSTASCSPATTCRSAPSAAAPSSRLSTLYSAA